MKRNKINLEKEEKILKKYRQGRDLQEISIIFELSSNRIKVLIHRSLYEEWREFADKGFQMSLKEFMDFEQFRNQYFQKYWLTKIV